MNTELMVPRMNLEAAKSKNESTNATPPIVRAAAAIKALIVHFLFQVAALPPKKSPPKANGIV